MISNQDEFTSQYKEMYNLCRVIYVRAPCLFHRWVAFSFYLDAK